MSDQIKVFAPASIGNVGPGYDTLGLAISDLGDTVIARKISSGIVVKHLESKAPLSTDPLKNTVCIAAQAVLEKIDCSAGIEFEIYKGLPVGSGLGSSAASAAAGAFAANELYGRKLDTDDLIYCATIAEEKASGGFFADNTAPSILGGAVVCRSLFPLDIIKLGTIDNLRLIMVTPEITILTKHAREILPKTVPINKFVFNMANTACVAAAFATNDYSLLARSLHDLVIAPVRSELITGYETVKDAALEAGADGMCISGSGPTVFAISDNDEIAAKVEMAMVKAFEANGISASSSISLVDNLGARVLDF